MRKPMSVEGLTALGRVRLSRSFFMRDFLYSEVAALHGIANIPDDPDRAIMAGKRLCEELLEPLQQAFGRVVIRSAYRSAELNAFANEAQRAGRKGYTCANNEKNRARHIWDVEDAQGCTGATACVVIPAFADRFTQNGDWRRLAWWIHDHLPYSELEFFPVNWAFNIGWRSTPIRAISSHAEPRGYLTRPGMANHAGRHEAEWIGIETA